MSDILGNGIEHGDEHTLVRQDHGGLYISGSS